jgi:arylsulfatase A-like enzyme
VPLIARWPGKIPAGHESDEPAMTLDLFTTSIQLSGGNVPTDRVIDGKDIWPVLTSDAKSPHESLLSFKGDELRTIRSGKWKLHVAPPGATKEKVWSPDEEWLDPRRPDGVRLIAPYEQAHPSAFPGLMTGDVYDGGALFDLDKDKAEQHNVMKQHPEVVKRLKRMVAAYRESFAKS